MNAIVDEAMDENDNALVKQEEVQYCQLLRQWAFSELNIYYAALGLSIDPRNHPYRDAILFGWLVFHGGLHALLDSFPILKEHYGRQHLIPLPMEAYTSAQAFSAFRHLGLDEHEDEDVTVKCQREIRYVQYILNNSSRFRRRFHQVVV